MASTSKLVAFYPTQRTSYEQKHVDIILVPGVGTAHPQNWRCDSSSWVQSLVTDLSSDGQPRVQFWYFEYDFDRSTALMPQVFSKGKDLFICASKTLRSNDEQKESRPLIFIGHGVGGIILKSALSTTRQFYRHVYNRIKNIIFLSTPHLGRDFRSDHNLVELILRTNNTPKRKELTSNDNDEIVKICTNYDAAMLHIPVLHVYEVMYSVLQADRWIKFRKQKHPPSIIVVEKSHVPAEGKGVKIMSMEAVHNDTCKIAVGGDVYSTIHRIASNAIQDQTPSINDGTDSSLSTITKDSSLEDEPGLDDFESHGLEGDHSKPLEPRADLELLAESVATLAINDDQIVVPGQLLNLPIKSATAVSQNPNFFGRQDVLKLIDDHFRTPDNAPITELSTFALCGIGGLGKTQIAIEYLYSRAPDYDAVFWLPADDKTILAQSMARIAIDLGLEKDGEGTQNLAVSCELVLSWLANPVKVLDCPSQQAGQARWLIVFDNADDLKMLDNYWPKDGVGSIVVTSRDPTAKTHFKGRHSGLDLRLLSTKDGAQFLEQLTREQSLSDHDGSLESVSELLGGLPLAITQMAGMMVELRLTSYREFLEVYNQEGARKLHRMQGGEQQAGNFGYNHTLATVWALDQLKPEALALFRIIAMLDPDKIPEMILQNESAGLKNQAYPKGYFEYYKARAQLLKSSLITVNDAEKHLIVHRVVREEIVAEMTKEVFENTFNDALSLVVKSSVIRLKRTFEDVPGDSTFHPDDSFAELLNDLGWYLLERGLVQESKAYYQLAQHICETSPNKDTEAVLLTLRMAHNNQTTAAAETNERRDCLNHSLVWMNMSQDRKTPNGQPLRDYELGIVYNETGVAYGMNENWRLAEEYFLKSIEVMKEQPNYDDTMLGWPEPNLGLIYWIQGRYDEAETVLNEILEVQAIAFGVDDTQSFKTGKILHALGNLLWSQNRMDESLNHHERAFKQYMSTLGSGHHRTADVRHRLAMHFLRLGRLVEAQTMIDEALKVFKAGPYHKPEEARSSFKRSHILAKQDRKEDAEKAMHDAVLLRSKIVPTCSKSLEELTDDDFDRLPIFWSR